MRHACSCHRPLDPGDLLLSLCVSMAEHACQVVWRGGYDLGHLHQVSADSFHLLGHFIDPPSVSGSGDSVLWWPAQP